MQLRRVGLGPVLRKANRIARDIAASSKKDLAVEIVGEDVAIDRSLLGIVDAALLHLVRNSADHGIEQPDARKAAGKKAQGTITVSAEIIGDELLFSVGDDGKGIDPERVRTKAEKMGIVKPGVPIGESELVDLVFSPGVSTATTVTDISGRGVGLDAVRHSVLSTGGSITIDNRLGQGCVFHLRIPVNVTTQIIPAYMFQIAGRAFGLPLSLVGETFRCAASDISSLGAHGLATLRHGHTLPIRDLRGQLEPRPAKAGEDPILITVQAGAGPLALAVDGVLGVQQVVVRPIEGSIPLPAWITGAALMGDGSVALMLDLPQLVAS
jgi:two-component system chemotaxis sensor kinase CheA